MTDFNRIATMGRDQIGPLATHPSYQYMMEAAKARFAACGQLLADRDEQDERVWLNFWAGPQWGDEAPNRLFGAWLNQDGEAV